MEKEVLKVKPIIIYPKCIIEDGKQGNCYECNNLDECLSNFLCCKSI